MQKKILGICAALVALAAFAIAPTVASATKLVDTSEGVTKTLPTPVKITAIGTQAFGDDSVLKSPTGETVTCTQNSMTGTLLKNGAAVVEGTIEHATFSGEGPTTGCKGGFLLGNDVKVAIFNLPWCITTEEGVDRFNATPADCGKTGGAFTFTLTGNNITCGFERTEAVAGTFTTPEPAKHEASTLSMNTAKFVTDGKAAGHSGLCPASGEITEMKFKLFTHTENYTKSEEDPVWFEK